MNTLSFTIRNLQLPLAALAAVCLASGAAWAGDPCSKADVEKYSTSQVNSQKREYCDNDPLCLKHIQAHAKIATSFNNEIKALCGTLSKALPDTQNQAQSREKVKELLTTGAAGYKKLASAAEKYAKNISSNLKNDVNAIKRDHAYTRHAQTAAPAAAGALAPAATNPVMASVQKIESTVSAADEVVDKAELPPDNDLKRKFGSTRFGTELRKKILDFKEEAETGEFKFNEKLGELDNPNGPTENPGSGEKKEGGLLSSLASPGTLIPLATAGLGLLAAKKNSSPADNSSISAAETPPPPAVVAGASLSAPNSTAGDKPHMANTEPSKLDIPTSLPTYQGNGEMRDPESTVSASRAPSGTTNTPVSGSAGGGGGGAMGGGGESGKAPADPAATLAAKSTDDGLSAFSGGGGAMSFGSSAPSTSTDAAATPAEDPLKETLHDMAEAVDNSAASENASGDNPAEGVTLEGDDEIFSRVKSCITRSLKKGLVVNGLSAKIR